MKLIRFFVRNSRWLTPAVVLGLLGGLANAALMYVVARAIGEGDLSVSAGLAFAALVALMVLGRVGSQLLLVSAHEKAVAELRRGLVHRLLASPLRNLEESGAHRYVASVSDDISTLSQSVVAVPEVLASAAMIVGLFVVLATLSWQLFLVLVGCLALVVLNYRLLVSRAFRLVRQARDLHDVWFKQFSAALTGIKELKLSEPRRHMFLARQIEPTTSTLQDLGTRGTATLVVAATWGTSLAFVFIGALLFVVPHAMHVTLDVLSGYALGVLFLRAPVDAVLGSLPVLGRAGIALEKLESIGMQLARSDQSEAAGPSTRPSPAADAWQTLEFAGVTHAYRRDHDDRTFTLGPIDLSFRRGELVFIVGGNGSGKTTLAKLLTGLYVPEAGEVRVDGRTLKPEETEQQRSLFSAVFADFHLFEDLVETPDAEHVSRATRYLKELQLSHKVRIEGNVLSTTELSQGQRKRLALLQAYLEDRPIYLFDEWAADQDPLFKATFYDVILPDLKQRGKAVIAITHDERYFGVADRVIKLESGQIVRS